MCVIIHKPADKEVPIAHLIEAMRCNPQGWGLAYIEAGKVKTDHGFAQDRALKAVQAVMDKELIFHARVATSGNINMENLHPFEIVRDQLYVAHNGVFRDLSDYHSRHCDSWHFADQMKPFFERYGLRLLDTEIFLGWAQLFCGKSNRLAFLSPDGAVIINRELGIELNGLWYSNTTAFPIPARHVKRGAIITDDEEDSLILGMEDLRDKKRKKGLSVGSFPPADTDEEAISRLTHTGENFSRMSEAGVLGTHTFPPKVTD